MQFFVGAMLSGGPPGAAYCAADLTADGVVDETDVRLFVCRLLEIPPEACP
jgi:hypothetical protein